MAHMTTVSQNVPDDDTRAWRTGFLVCAAAATRGAEPRPDSLENNPRAMPYLAAMIMAEPASPPVAASSVNADSTMRRMAGSMKLLFMQRMTTHPMT